MLPSPLAESLGNFPSESQIPRPRLYLPSGPIASAWRAQDVLFTSKRPSHSAAQRSGLNYQKHILRWLEALSPQWRLTASPWFCFCDDSPRRHYCQPDFLLESLDCVVIGEIKARWTSDAWWQLRKLYEPVVRVADRHHLRGRHIVVLTICKSYDPSIRIPEPAVLGLAPSEGQRAKFDDHFNVWVRA